MQTSLYLSTTSKALSFDALLLQMVYSPCLPEAAPQERTLSGLCCPNNG